MILLVVLADFVQTMYIIILVALFDKPNMHHQHHHGQVLQVSNLTHWVLSGKKLHGGVKGRTCSERPVSG